MFGGTGGKGALTVTFVLPLTPVYEAVIFVLPAETGTTVAGLPGISKTVATEVLEEIQVASAVRSSVVPSAKFPVAVSWRFWAEPTETVGFEGETVTETSGTVTVTSLEATTDPFIAVIVVVPELNAVTIPALPAALLTEATAGDDEFQTTDCKSKELSPAV
jgi:hypothetical protein